MDGKGDKWMDVGSGYTCGWVLSLMGSFITTSEGMDFSWQRLTFALPAEDCGEPHGVLGFQGVNVPRASGGHGAAPGRD